MRKQKGAKEEEKKPINMQQSVRVGHLDIESWVKLILCKNYLVVDIRNGMVVQPSMLFCVMAPTDHAE